MAEKEKCEVDRHTERQSEKEREQKFSSVSKKSREWQPVLPWDSSRLSEARLTWDLLAATISESREDEGKRKRARRAETDKGRGEALTEKEGKRERE